MQAEASGLGIAGRVLRQGSGRPGPHVPGYVIRAERHRRGGDPAEALRVLEAGADPGEAEASEARVARALALWDLGRAEEARVELEAALTLVPRGDPGEDPDITEPTALGGLDEAELDRAFEMAEPDLEETVDADRIALEAMREADLERPEGLITNPDSPFATRTVAELLERQGDRDGAEVVRNVLQEKDRSRSALAADGPATPLAARRAQVIETLERWLENLRRGRS